MLVGGIRAPHPDSCSSSSKPTHPCPADWLLGLFVGEPPPIPPSWHNLHRPLRRAPLDQVARLGHWMTCALVTSYLAFFPPLAMAATAGMRRCQLGAARSS